MLSFSTWREYRLRDRLTECFWVRQGAGTTVLCKPAFRFPQFYLSKAVLYTQSVVRVLYLARVLYSVRSPHFIPSPCFIPSPQSVVRSPQSAVHILYWPDQCWHSIRSLMLVQYNKVNIFSLIFTLNSEPKKRRLREEYGRPFVESRYYQKHNHVK